jgi:hypothetical protein
MGSIVNTSYMGTLPMIQTGVALYPSIPFAPGLESGNYFILFDAHSASTTSHIIVVDESPFVVEAYGLTGGETVQVWNVGGSGVGQWFSQLYLKGVPVLLTPTDNKLSLDVSGRYQFRLNGGGLGTVFVIGQNANVASNLVGLGKFIV